MSFYKIVDSTVEWFGLNGRNKENQVNEKNDVYMEILMMKI